MPIRKYHLDRQAVTSREIEQKGIKNEDIADNTIIFLDKLDVKKIVVTSSTFPTGPRESGPFSHGLGRVPIGYIITWKDDDQHIYRATPRTAWTSTSVYFHFSDYTTACTAHIVLF